MNKTTHLAVWLGLALLVIILDQLTKTLILGSFQLNDTRAITSFFNLTRHHNSGAAFSFLAGASGWQRYVVDFLQFRFALLEPIFRGGYFPTFNLADSAITLGAVLLIVDEVLRVKRGG